VQFGSTPSNKGSFQTHLSFNDIERLIPPARAQFFAFIMFAFSFFCAGCGETQSLPDPASLEIQNRMPGAGILHRGSIQTDSIYSYDLVHAFYEERAFRPAWSSPKGILPDADSLIDAIKAADREGLRPQDYHLSALEAILHEIKSREASKEGPIPSIRADLDLLLTDAFLLYASHLSEGCIDRDSLKMRRALNGNDLGYDSLLQRSIEKHAIPEGLRQLLPQHPLYADLKELLASYGVMARRGRWGVIPSGAALKGGDVGTRVFALKSRLRVSGDLLSRSGAEGDEYDSSLVDAVRAFQKRHGLEPSGVADSLTLAALNVPLEKRIEQIKITMERWRWMPHRLGHNYIRINIPDFRLYVIENGREVETMKVVLGLPNWQTPVFSAVMTQVLFNSRWMAPEDIVEKELINYMKADSNYFRSNNMTLWREVHDSLVQVDPRTIDWPAMNEKTIDFRLRQEAGPQNIMGQIKFLIPNKFNIYLHDTPYREDFPKPNRMFSHGCIRLERPSDLAEYVLRDFPEWTKERIDTVIARNEEQSLFLKKRLPVHVLYYTVWRENDGSVQFREDFYGLDRRLGWVLQAAQPKPAGLSIAVESQNASH
jgi:murein L,D-transpeptidase YcbB/YkuD